MDWYYGIWFVGDGSSWDWLCTLGKKDGKLALRYRFRYYDKEDPGNDPFSEKDKKSWWSGTMDDTPENLQQSLTIQKEIVGLVEARAGGAKADFIHLECSPSDPKFLFKLGSRPWAHIKRLDK